MKLLRFTLVLVAALLLSSCWSEPETGPVEIRYDREVCIYCQMIISDPRFAAEVRQGKGKEVYKFDDLGDAIHWLKIVSWKETKETEIWVRDMKTGKIWLDARKAWYKSGMHTPMEYGFGAVKDQAPGTVSFEEMRKDVIAQGSTTRCETPLHQSDEQPPARIISNKDKKE